MAYWSKTMTCGLEWYTYILLSLYFWLIEFTLAWLATSCHILLCEMILWDACTHMAKWVFYHCASCDSRRGCLPSGIVECCLRDTCGAAACTTPRKRSGCVAYSVHPVISSWVHCLLGSQKGTLVCWLVSDHLTLYILSILVNFCIWI